MKHTTQIIVSAFFPLYLATVLFTDFSFIGFWTDSIASLILSILSLRIIFKAKRSQTSMFIVIVNGLCLLTIAALAILVLSNPFSVDYFQLRSFWYQSVDGRLFNAYFKPVGSYSGGYGNFWITETPKYFPLVEHQVYYERAVDYDFRADSSEGKSVDNDEVVRSYTRQQVIEPKAK